MHRSLLLALPLLLLACGPDFSPTGNQGVLFVNRPQSTLAEGLQWTLELPASVVAPSGSALGVRKRYDYEFTGTQLEASGSGLSLVDASLGQEGWRAHVRCDKSQPGGRAELTLKITAGGAARYTDTIDVPCLPAVRMRYQLPAAREVIGNRVTVPYELSAQEQGGAEVPLDGEGWLASDSTPFVRFGRRSVESTFVLETLGAGSTPIAVAGSFQAPLVGLEVVPDDAWDLVFDTKHSSDRHTPLYSYAVKAGAKDGKPLGALTGCKFLVAAGSREETLTQECEGTFDASGGLHVCALFRDKRTCKDLTP